MIFYIPLQAIRTYVSFYIKVRIAFVGAGRLASHLASALYDAGHDVAGVWSRTLERAAALASRLDCVATDALDALPEAEIYVFAVADDALPAVAEQMERLHPDAVFVHTAGCVPLSVFDGHKGGGCGVVYPLQTFSHEAQLDFHAVPVFVEGSDAATTDLLKRLMTGVAASVAEADSTQRAWLHLAAVFACNFPNCCYAAAEHLMKGAGMSFASLLPLIDETARKVHLLSPAEAQTGPAARGDRSVMTRHETLLHELGSRESEMLTKMYQTMSECIASFVGNKKEGKDNHDKL